MRVANWKANEIFQGLRIQALDNANSAMDDVVVKARQKYDSYPHPYSGRRGPDVFVTRNVSFTPKTGKRAGSLVQFKAKTWLGDNQGLRATIRRVNKPGSGNVRVYAGNYKVFYARFVERGTVKMKAKPFLRPAFNEIKASITRRIARG